jgi:hypothetical protein
MAAGVPEAKKQARFITNSTNLPSRPFHSTVSMIDGSIFFHPAQQRQEITAIISIPFQNSAEWLKMKNWLDSTNTARVNSSASRLPH